MPSPFVLMPEEWLSDVLSIQWQRVGKSIVSSPICRSESVIWVVWCLEHKPIRILMASTRPGRSKYLFHPSFALLTSLIFSLEICFGYKAEDQYGG